MHALPISSFLPPVRLGYRCSILGATAAAARVRAPVPWLSFLLSLSELPSETYPPRARLRWSDRRDGVCVPAGEAALPGMLAGYGVVRSRITAYVPLLLEKQACYAIF